MMNGPTERCCLYEALLQKERERESYKVVVDRRLLKSVPLVSAEGPLHSENYCYHEAVHQFTSAYSARQHLPSADE